MKVHRTYTVVASGESTKDIIFHLKGFSEGEWIHSLAYCKWLLFLMGVDALNLIAVTDFYILYLYFIFSCLCCSLFMYIIAHDMSVPDVGARDQGHRSEQYWQNFCCHEAQKPGTSDNKQVEN